MAELSKGRLRNKREELSRALEGRVKDHHRFLLTELLSQIDGFEETIARFDTEIEEYCRPFDEAVALLDTIPSVARATAENIVAEIGNDMSRFPTANHVASWAGVAPGNNESAGKKRSCRTRQGNKPLGVASNPAAHAAAYTKDTYLSTQYHRLAGRRDKKSTLVAVAHSILVISYFMIKRHVPYCELGSDYFGKRRPETTAKRLVTRLVHIGY